MDQIFIVAIIGEDDLENVFEENIYYVDIISFERCILS